MALLICFTLRIHFTHLIYPGIPDNPDWFHPHVGQSSNVNSPHI